MWTASSARNGRPRTLEITVILRCSYEEMVALRSGARTMLGQEVGVPSPVLAPPESRARIESLMPRLIGDISLDTLEDVWGVEAAVAAIVECLRAEMETAVLAHHAADEMAVSAYFEFAHALSVANRLAEVAQGMSAVIELVTGAPPTPETARTFDFPG